jgi:hypothetical protein
MAQAQTFKESLGLRGKVQRAGQAVVDGMSWLDVLFFPSRGVAPKNEISLAEPAKSSATTEPPHWHLSEEFWADLEKSSDQATAAFKLEMRRRANMEMG